MRNRTKQTAHDVSAGARALLRRERRPFHLRRNPVAVGGRTRALPSYATRESLEAAARRQALLARGRTRFVVESRLVAIGVPLGIVAGALAWRSGRSSHVRSVAQFALAFGAALGLTFLEAEAEWRGMEEADGL